MYPDCPELTRFLRGEIDPAAFPHREHIRIAFEMLQRLDFAESVWQFSKTLRAMATRAGRPQAFNQTVTIAFLSLIAEGMERGRPADFAAFERDHAEVFDKSALARWYPAERLATEAARRIFLLPQPPLQGPIERRRPRKRRTRPLVTGQEATASERPAAIGTALVHGERWTEPRAPCSGRGRIDQ